MTQGPDWRSTPEPKWPYCPRCRRTATPGLECARLRCPWQREDGRIVTPRKSADTPSSLDP